MTSPPSSNRPLLPKKSGREKKKDRTIFKPLMMMMMSVIVALVAVTVVHLNTVDDLKTAFRTVALPHLLRLGWRTGLISHLLLRWVEVDVPTTNSTKTTDAGGFYMLRRAASASWYRTILEEFEPDANDVVVATYPKSGTHLTMQLTVQSMSGGSLEFESIHHVATLVEFEKISPENCDDPNILTILNYREVKERRGDGQGEGTLHATHLPVEMILRDGVGDGDENKDGPTNGGGGGGARYMVMMRHPLDVLHSLRNVFVKTLGESSAPTHYEVYRTILRRTGHGWARYNLDWWERHVEDPDRILFLFYEDAIANLTDTVIRIFDFLGVDSNDKEAVERVRYRGSMEYMKPRADKFDPPSGCGNMIPGGGKGRKKGVFVNEGKVGRGRENMPIGLRREVERYYHETFDGTSFPVERYAGTFV